ncbi:hypothetical protein D6850_09045 [Roseovarius spongiae]|uniref:VPLPA-CTERM sorting domain-containing protein n=1 Tax=Roseovarius spongiae TaxID=2320272 RepID=A0A3A8B5K9_9RHOB|nr:VPLPA-CTERM sorting domain-containing protein [Roseovarius spongiae]RKF14996.1 hypothetical protein D6850_09045 [Roseovarius spongiae]
MFEATVTDAGGFDVTAASGSSFPGNHAQFTGTIFGGEGIAISGVENFSGVLASGGYMTSLSFDVYEPTTTQTLEGCNWGSCTDSTFTLELFNGAASIASTSFNPTDDAIFNFGLALAPGQKFDRFVITELNNTVDNEFFANFKADLAPIPLPATGWLLIAALGGLVLRRRMG